MCVYSAFKWENNRKENTSYSKFEFERICFFVNLSIIKPKSALKENDIIPLVKKYL